MNGRIDAEMVRSKVLDGKAGPRTREETSVHNLHERNDYHESIYIGLFTQMDRPMPPFFPKKTNFNRNMLCQFIKRDEQTVMNTFSPTTTTTDFPYTHLTTSSYFDHDR